MATKEDWKKHAADLEQELARADAYRLAAIYLYRFVTDHVAIVGHEEITAWHVAKDLYDKAVRDDA
jgi:hypothetical protein